MFTAHALIRRLAAYICGYEVFQISVTASYGIPEFKLDLLALYTKVLASFDLASPNQ